MTVEPTAPNGAGPDPTPPAATLQDVPLDQIHQTFDTQARVAISDHTVNRYAEAMREGASFPPVTLFHNAEEYWIGDGHHRCRAAQQVGSRTISAEVREGDERDAFLYACSANTAHGDPRTDSDIRYIVWRLLTDEEWGRWSSREIARRCAVSHTFVDQRRKELAERRAADERLTGNVASERTYTTKHGTVATMDTSRIGTREAAPAPRTDEAPPDMTVAGDIRAPMPRNSPPTKVKGRWRDPLEEVEAALTVVLDGFTSFGGIAAVVRRWPPENQQAFGQRIAAVEARVQRLLREFETVRATVMRPETTDHGEREEEPA